MTEEPKAPEGARQPPPRGGGVDPVEFLRRMLKISPEDAEAAREQAAKDAQGDDGRVVKLDAVITCPNCGHAATERMPTDACQHFYDCSGCGQRLTPKPGDCCVFCSYADSRCPPTQEG